MGKIGNVEVSGRVFLGPMAGVTSLAYRDFMKPFGVALSFSEMISDCALVYENRKTDEYFKTSKIDRPVALQLFGSNPEISAKAVSILENRAEYDLLDINFGCPVHKVVKTGAGSAFLKDPARMYEYARTIVKASHKPVTAKIRLGWDSTSINFLETSKLLEDAGVSLLSIHSRTTAELYAGEAHHEMLAELKGKLSIPLCVSGDIFSAEAALKAMEVSGAEYVMVARGGIGNPNLVTNINLALEGKETIPFPSVMEQVGFARQFMALLVEEKGEAIAVRELRGLLPHFFKGFRGYKKIRNDIATMCRTMDDYERVLKRVEETGRL